MSANVTESVDGILNIDKPQGYTSHDVVARVRRLSGQRRVGHAGTLDPMATGVLLVCLGKATRLVEYLADGIKVYRATIRFGVVTDTWDAEGTVVARGDGEGLALAEIREALAAFVGQIEQVPPMYSALKHHGQPLYRLARRGVTIERRPRLVEIHRLEVLAWQPPDLVLQVTCSKGTYVRSLAHELGQRLGPGAHLAALTRIAVGRFGLQDAVALDTLMAQGADGSWRRHLLPIERGVGDLPGVVLDAEAVRRVAHGQALAFSGPEVSPVAAYDATGHLVAILERAADSWRPRKVFVTIT